MQALRDIEKQDYRPTLAIVGGSMAVCTAMATHLMGLTMGLLCGPMVGLVAGTGAYLRHLSEAGVPWRATGRGYLRLARVPTVASHPDEIQGRVTHVMGEPLVAPISGQACVAFRLVGTFGGHEVDDADAVPFLLTTPTGERVHIAAPPASVSLPPRGLQPTPRHAWPRVVAFMAARGVPQGRQPAALSEMVLCIGQSVVVRGATTTELDPDAEAGYRDTPRRRVVSDTAQRPLVFLATD